MNGNVEIGIKKDLNKAISLFEDISDDLIEASEELIYIYYKLFLDNNNQKDYYYNKIILYKQKCELNIKYTEEIKKRIENILSEIKNRVPPIEIPE